MVQLIAEIGLNYAYGESCDSFISNAKNLIDLAVLSGFNYVKFQKRTPVLCVPHAMADTEKVVPWRQEPTTYLQYKDDIEFSYDDYVELIQYCKSKGIGIFVSVWDTNSVAIWNKLCKEQCIKCIMKIPSAKITDLVLCRSAREKSEMLMVSTGMSTEAEITSCVSACNPDVIFHTNSAYPTPVNDLHLGYIKHLQSCYKDKEIGYSGHEFGLDTTIATVALGVTWIERHVTLDRTLWGSDQSASVEPVGMFKLVKGVRELEQAMSGNCFRTVFDSELKKKKSLRG